MHISNNPLNPQRRALMVEEKASQKLEEKKQDLTGIVDEEDAVQYTAPGAINVTRANSAGNLLEDDLTADTVDIAGAKSAPARPSRVLDMQSARALASEAQQRILADPTAAMAAQCNTSNATAWKLLA